MLVAAHRFGCRGLNRPLLVAERASCLAVMFEAILAAVTDTLLSHPDIPVTGIGAGPGIGGQVLILHGVFGIHDGHVARFVKTYADLRGLMIDAVAA